MVLNLPKYMLCFITFHSCVLTVVVGMDDLEQGVKRKIGILTRGQARQSNIVVPEIKDASTTVVQRKKVKVSNQLVRSYTMHHWATGGGVTNVMEPTFDLGSVDSSSCPIVLQSSSDASPRYVDRTISLQKRLQEKEDAYQAAIAAEERIVTESDTDADVSIASSNAFTPQKSGRVQINAVAPLIRQFTYNGKDNPTKVPVYDAEQRIKKDEKKRNKEERKATAHIPWLTYNEMKDHQALYDFNSEIGKIRNNLIKISTHISTDSQDEDIQACVTEFNTCIESISLKVFCRNLSHDYSSNRDVPIDKGKHAHLINGIFDDVVARLDAFMARLAALGVDFNRVNFEFDSGMTYYQKQKNRLADALFKFIGHELAVLERSETLHDG
jgi:hypothetical protein